jgi:hypothetical protein
MFAAPRPRGPEAALASAWAAAIPVAAVWIGRTALDGRTYHLAPVLVAAAPGFAARLLGLSVLGSGVVGASVVMAGVIAALGAWGFLELTGLATTATLWPGLPGGVRAEIAGAIGLGALAGLGADYQRAHPHRERTSRQ